MKPSLFFALLTAPAALLSAQSTQNSQTVIDRAQQATLPPATPDAPAGVTISPGDADSGNQRIAQKRALPFTLFLSYDAQLYFTDNVFLSAPETNPEWAYIFAQTLSARAEFTSFAWGDGVVTPSAGVAYQRFYHGIGQGNNYSSLDFDSYSLPLGLSYRFGDNWEASASLTANSVCSNNPESAYEEILLSYTTSFGLRKLVALAPDKILSFGVGAAYSYTDANTSDLDALISYRNDRNDKCDYSADVAYYYMIGQWVLSPSARLGYADYLHYQEAAFSDVNRRDLSTSLGASVSYNLSARASARLFTSYDWRTTQGADPSNAYNYKSKTIGLGLSLNAEF